MEMSGFERLKKIRVAKNILQEDFAKGLNISISTYRAMEQGKREINTQTLKALKEKYNVSSDWLLFGEESGKGEEIDIQSIKNMMFDNMNVFGVFRKFIESIINLGDNTNFSESDKTQDLKDPDLSNYGMYKLVKGHAKIMTNILLDIAQNGLKEDVSNQEIVNSLTNQSEKMNLLVQDITDYFNSNFDNYIDKICKFEWERKAKIHIED